MGLGRRLFETPLGEVWLWGSAEAFDTSAATVLGITGAFASPDAMRDFPSLIDAPVLIADLPGNRCPRLSTQSVGAYAAAFSDVARQLDRPIAMLGVSLGATVALGVRAANVGPRLAIEPLLNSDSARALWPTYRRRLAMAAPDDPEREFRWTIFGVAERRTERRSYLHLLNGAPEGSVVGAGEITTGAQASILSLEDRQAVRAAHHLRLVTLQGMGHTPTPRAAGWAACVLPGMLARAGLAWPP